MSKWKIKYKVFEAKVLMEVKYAFYRLKSALGIKSKGYNRNDGVIFFKLLKKYKLPIYSMHVLIVSENLSKVNIENLHNDGLKIDKDDYLSIISNPMKRQVNLVVGTNLNAYINESNKIEIETQMIEMMEKNEIFASIEHGMNKIRKCLISHKKQ